MFYTINDHKFKLLMLNTFGLSKEDIQGLMYEAGFIYSVGFDLYGVNK